MNSNTKQYLLKEIEKLEEEDCSFNKFIFNCTRINELYEEFKKKDVYNSEMTIAFRMMFLSAVYKFYPNDMDLKLFVSIRDKSGEMFRDAVSKGGNMYLLDTDIIKRYFNNDIKSKCPIQYYYFYLYSTLSIKI